MQNEAIFIPMCVYTLLLFGLWGLVGWVRITGAQRGEISGQYLRVGIGEPPPERIVMVHHHFSNQFEVPVLFYVACMALFLTDAVGSLALWLAWFFVAMRVAHTAIVVTTNRPQVRVIPFVLGSLTVWALWVAVFVRVVGGAG